MKRITAVVALAVLVLLIHIHGQSLAQCPGGNCPVPQQGWQAPRIEYRAPAPVPRQQTNYLLPPEAVAPESVVRLQQGSGVLIDKGPDYGLIVTAYHVVKGLPRNNHPVAFADGTVYRGRTIPQRTGTGIAIDAEGDLAFIQIPQPKADPCRLARRRPVVGAAVRIGGWTKRRVGAALRFTWRVATGRVQKYTFPDKRRMRKKSWFECSGLAVPGMSGGPIFNESGELVGIIHGSTFDSWRKHGQYTKGPSVSLIHYMVCEDQYIWPFGFRDKTRKSLQQHDERLDDLERQKLAERVEQPQIPEQVPTPIPVYDDKPVLERLVKVETVVDEHTQKVKHYDTIIEEIKAEAAKLRESSDASQAAIGNAVASVEGKVLERLTPRIEQGVAVAQEAAEATAENVAGAAVEEAKGGLREFIREKLPDGLVAKVDAVKAAVGGFKTWITGSYVGLGILAAFVLYVFLDVRAKIKTGDPLGVEKLAALLQRGADRTANPVDDVVTKTFAAAAGALGTAVERLGGVADRLEAKVKE